MDPATVMDTTSRHQAQASKLFQAFNKGTPDTLEELLELFSPDAKFYMYGPQKAPMDGHKQIREGFEGTFAQLKEFSIRILKVAENGNVLFVERVEKFRFKDKHDVELNLVSVSQLGSDGRLVSWTDYFDSSILTELS